MYILGNFHRRSKCLNPTLIIISDIYIYHISGLESLQGNLHGTGFSKPPKSVLPSTVLSFKNLTSCQVDLPWSTLLYPSCQVDLPRSILPFMPNRSFMVYPTSHPKSHPYIFKNKKKCNNSSNKAIQNQRGKAIRAKGIMAVSTSICQALEFWSRSYKDALLSAERKKQLERYSATAEKGLSFPGEPTQVERRQGGNEAGRQQPQHRPLKKDCPINLQFRLNF